LYATVVVGACSLLWTVTVTWLKTGRITWQELLGLLREQLSAFVYEDS